MTYSCDECGDWVHSKRWALGYRTCRTCGDAQARAARASWCVAPLNKSNYVLISDLTDLKNLNPKTVRD